MSGKDALQALEVELGARAPKGVGRLSDEELRDLAAAVSDARRRQALEVQVAGEKALAHIPWLLRGPVRRIIG